MKKILLIVFIFSTVFAFAKTEKISVYGKTVELIFDNIELQSLKYYKSPKIKINYDKDSNIKVKKENKKVVFSSENFSKMKLWLPEDKTYIFVKDKNVNKFNEDYVHITTADSTIIEFKDKELTVIENDGDTIVRIDDEGIFINDNGEFVEISDRGIIIESENENKHITGFWGKLLGNFVRFISQTSISLVGKNPDVIARKIINNEDESDLVMGYNLSKFGNLSEKKTAEEQHYTFQPSDKTKVHIININGKTIIEKWEKDYIDVNAFLKTKKNKKELQKVQINVSDEGGCTIETIHLGKNPKVTVNYKIKVPDFVRIKNVTNTNGIIRLTATEGDAILRSSNGKIEVFDHIGNIDAATSNGRIELVNINGTTISKTSNGFIRLIKNKEIMSAYSSNGKIIAELTQVKNDVFLRTSNGSVTIGISPELNCNIDAATSNSRIILNGLKITTDNFSDDHLKGVLGSGGKIVKIRSSNGKIILNNIEETEK